jgi:hypothetical protein
MLHIHVFLKFQSLLNFESPRRGRGDSIKGRRFKHTNTCGGNDGMIDPKKICLLFDCRWGSTPYGVVE